MNVVIVTVHAHTKAVAGQEAGSPSTAGDGGQDTVTTVQVDIGEPASNTSTTRPPRVDPQPRPHDPDHTKATTATGVPVTLPPTGAHPAATATGALFLCAAGIAAIALARRPKIYRSPNHGLSLDPGRAAQRAFHERMRRSGWRCRLDDGPPHDGPCPVLAIWWRHPIDAIRQHLHRF